MKERETENMFEVKEDKENRLFFVASIFTYARCYNKFTQFQIQTQSLSFNVFILT